MEKIARREVGRPMVVYTKSRNDSFSIFILDNKQSNTKLTIAKMQLMHCNMLKGMYVTFSRATCLPKDVVKQAAFNGSILSRLPAHQPCSQVTSWVLCSKNQGPVLS